MLTFNDCVALSGLTEEEVASVARHEHLPQIAALEMGDFLLHQRGGAAWMRHLLEDEIAKAASRRDFRRAAQCMQVLQGFVARHGVADTAGSRTAATTPDRPAG